MVILPLAAIGSTMMGLLLALVAIFLILLVLVQRGRGGGLAGALGGMGGSSAFGAKAGDVFTKITVVSASFWIFLCIGAARWGGSDESLLNITTKPSSTIAPGVTEDVEPGQTPADAAMPAAEAPAGEAAETPPADPAD